MTTHREQQVLELIRQDPMTSQQAIADRLGISRSAVAGHVMKLTQRGVIKGRSYVISEAPFVVAIGGANIDIHGRPSGALRLQDSIPGTIRSSPGGVARNVAENLARFGVDCRLVTAVGYDQYGHLLLRHCRDAGIDTQHVQQIDSARTSTYLSMLDRSGDLHVAINDMAVLDELGPKQIQVHMKMLKQASLIVLDTNLREDTLIWLTKKLSDNPLFVDTVSITKAKKIKRCLGAIHTLKTNPLEVETLTGMKAGTLRNNRKIAALLHDRGVVQLFITLGKGGVFYSTSDAQGIVEGRGADPTIRSTGGAGDAFLAGIAYSWLEKWNLQKSIRFAQAAASLTVADEASSSSTISLRAVTRNMRRKRVA